MSHLKIILLCSSRFAIPAMKELAFFNLLAAVAIPRQYDEMIENVEHGLTGSGVPLIELDKETFADQLREAMEDYQVTMGLVMTFPYKIPYSVYALPAKGFYNIHPGPLPAYRGADPVFQQIKNKEKYAGVTIQQLDEGIDTGPVVMGEMLKLAPTDTHGLLTTKLANLAAKLTGILIKLASFDSAIHSRPQDESRAGYFARQGAKDITIDWQTMNADSIIALIQACNPWNKGAVAKINNQVIRLLSAEKLTAQDPGDKEPGYVNSIDRQGMIVSTFNNEAILVSMIYAEEGFLHSFHLLDLGILPGARFEIM